MAQVHARQLYDQGVALARGSDLIRSEQYLAEAINRGMPQRQVLPILLRVCVAASRFRAAVNYARPYLDAHPNDWALRFLLATIEAGLGEHQAARRDLESVIEQRESHAEAHFTLATLLRENFNDPVGADRHYRRYLEVEPNGSHSEEARGGLLRAVAPSSQPVDPAPTNVPTPENASPSAPSAVVPATRPTRATTATPVAPAGNRPRTQSPRKARR